MSSVVLPLSLGKVRQLRDQLKTLARELSSSETVNRVTDRMEQAVCVGVAEDVRMGIGTLQDVDGNYLGANTSAVSVQVGMPGHDVIWRGQQIAYLEFGTGAAGAEGAYPGGAMNAAGYRPDPTKKEWAYLDDGTAVISHGIGPQAPMYNAGLAMRYIGALGPAKIVLKEAVQRAVTL